MGMRVEKLLVRRIQERRAIVSRMRRVEMAIRASLPKSRDRKGRGFTGLQRNRAGMRSHPGPVARLLY